MNIGKALLLLIGLIVVAAGLLFIGQGSGYINWPASSFMINNSSWIYYGGAIVTVGIILFVLDRR